MFWQIFHLVFLYLQNISVFQVMINMFFNNKCVSLIFKLILTILSCFLNDQTKLKHKYLHYRNAAKI